MSGLRVGRCLIWTTDFVDGARSSDFRIGNCEWYLTINISSILGEQYKDLIIRPKQIQDTPFRPFKLKCLYEKGTSNISSILFSKEIGSPTEEHRLWSSSTLNGELTFTFVFDEDISLDSVNLFGLSSLSSDLGALLASGDSSDVKLMTNSSTRSAHRTVLACRSEVFSAMFRSEMKESTSGLVDVRDMDGTIFDLFLGYIYTGRFPDNLPDNTLAHLYSAADKYAVHCLKKQCGYLLSRCVKQENHLALLVLADIHRDQWLKDSVIESIVKKPDWLKCEGWNQFSGQYQALANEVFLKLFNKTF